MIPAVGQRGTWSGHGFDRDVVRTFRMIDLKASPRRTEGERERDIRTAECEFRWRHLGTDEEVVEFTVPEFTVEALRGIKHQSPIIASHGKTSRIKSDMLE